MKKITYIYIALSLVLFSCTKEEKYNDLKFENMGSISAVLNKDVLLVHNSKLNNSNGTGGMEYDSGTGNITLTTASSEEAGYILKEGLVINVDLDTAAILRKIVTIDTLADAIHLTTEDVDLEEIFRDAEFELASDFDEDVKLKSYSTSEDIRRALCKGIRVSPARVISYTNKGVYSQSVFKDEDITNTYGTKGEATKEINFNYNLAGITIYESTSNNTHVKLSISEGNAGLGAKFVLATSIRKGKLKKFRFEVIPSASFSMKCNLYASASTGTISNTKKIKDNVFKKTYVYYLGGVLVVSVTIDCDIYAAYKFDASAQFNATTGFYATVWADLGARWDGSWSAIRDFGHNEGVYPFNYSANAISNLRVELYPKATAYIYGVNGISLDVVPYFTNTNTATSINGVNHFTTKTDFGLDARVFAKISIVNKTLASYSSGNITIIPPKNIFTKTW